MTKKTLDNFLEQLAGDADFRSFIEKLSGAQIAVWLDGHITTEVDAAELTTMLWLSLPDKPAVDMMQFKATWDTLRSSPRAPRSRRFADMILGFSRSWLARRRARPAEVTLPIRADELSLILDLDGAVNTLRLYNIGIKQAVMIPLSSGGKLEIILERGHAPTVAESRAGAKKRLADLLVSAARAQPTKVQKTLY